MRIKGSAVIDGLFTADRTAYFRDYTTFSGQAEFQDRLYTDNILSDAGVMDIGLPGTPSHVTASGDVFHGGSVEIDGTLYTDGNIVTDGLVDGRDISTDGSNLDAHIADLSLHGSVSDHGDLLGLSNDDHTGYLLANGTRGLSDAWAANERIYNASGVLNLGTAASTSHGISTGSIITGGSLEVNGPVYIDNTISGYASLSATAGTEGGIGIYPTVAQGGTAAYSALLVDVTENSTGSGSKRLLDLLVGGSTRFFVENDGTLNLGASATTSIKMKRSAANTWQLLGDTGANMMQVSTGSSMLLLGGGALTYSTVVGFIAQSGSFPAWLYQSQNGIATRVLARADAAGEIGVIAGSAALDSEGANAATLLRIATNVANTTSQNLTIAKHEFYGDGRSRLGLNSTEITTASGITVLHELAGRINQTGTGGFTGLLVSVAEVGVGSGTKNLQDLQVSGLSKFRVEDSGDTFITGNASFLGDARLRGYTTAAADPTVSQYPQSLDWGFHKNSSSGNLYLVFNDGGVIKKVTLT
jgi:hypothetical protein